MNISTICCYNIISILIKRGIIPFGNNPVYLVFNDLTKIGAFLNPVPILQLLYNYSSGQTAILNMVSADLIGNGFSYFMANL